MDPVSFLVAALPPRWAGGVFGLVAVCAWLDAAIPQPGPGSAWIKPRRLMSWIGGNWANARNSIQPGSVAATVTPAALLEVVTAGHVSAAEQRDVITGKLADVQRRVTQVQVQTADKP